MPIGTFLNGRPYTSLRGIQWLSLSDVGTLLSLTSATDAGGGIVQTWGTAAGTIACRIDPIVGHEGVVADRISDRSTHLITVPQGVNVQSSNRFAITGRGTFEITAVRERTAELARFFEAVEVS